MAFPSYATIKKTILGHKWDVDNTGDYDCVDVAKEAAMLYFPGISLTELGIHGNGKDIFKNANPKYWKKVVNDHSNASQLPPAGAIIGFDPTPKSGYSNTYKNPYGHTALVDKADSKNLTILMQSSNTGKAAYLDTHAWRYRPVQGWLIPIAQTKPAPKPAPAPATVPKADLDAANKTIATQKDTIKQLTSANTTLNKNLQSAQEEATSLKLKLDDANSRNTELGKVVTNLQNANNKLTAQLAAAGDDTTQLNALGKALQWFVARVGLK